jgi:hypothetical protein
VVVVVVVFADATVTVTVAAATAAVVGCEYYLISHVRAASLLS